VIDAIHWRLLAGDHSPFEQTQERRHLRITIHCPNVDALSTEDRSRLALIRELARLDTIRIADTDPSAVWRFEVETRPNEYGAAQARIVGPDGPRIFMAVHPREWIEEAILMIGIGSASDPRTQDVAAHLPYLEAHADTFRDVFVTSYPEFLNAKRKWRHAHICDLSEGLKIIGLYLRFKDDFTIRTSELHQEKFDRALFYWVLCRQRLPAMWPYFSAALVRSRALHDQMEYLANTILDRGVRVLQARDQVGFAFYRPQSNTTRDEMLYHFDYLTLMLSGALDAEARVAHRIYNITKPKIRNVSFRQKDFLDALDGAAGQSLTTVAREPRFVEFQRFLGALRNSVHSIGLRGMGVSRAGEPQSSVIQVFEDAQELLQAASALGPPGDLGVDLSVGRVALEPYTCAVRLAEIGLQYVNRIAAATDVTRILPVGVSASSLMSGPPENDVYGTNVMRRIDALG
jgi:hypothetical protein